SSPAKGSGGVIIRARLVDVSTAGSRQLAEQLLRFFQIGGIEAFGEPVINGGENGARFLALPLALEEPGEARPRPQRPRFCTCPAGDRLANRGLSLALVGLPGGENEFAFEPVEFRLVKAACGLLDLGERFAHRRTPFLDPADLETRLGEKSEPFRPADFGASR